MVSFQAGPRSFGLGDRADRVAAVQAVLGHASPAETLEVYTHLWPTDEDRTREAIAVASEAWIKAASAR